VEVNGEKPVNRQRDSALPGYERENEYYGEEENGTYGNLPQGSAT
jgi:hypothetical protein